MYDLSAFMQNIIYYKKLYLVTVFFFFVRIYIISYIVNYKFKFN